MASMLPFACHLHKYFLRMGSRVHGPFWILPFRIFLHQSIVLYFYTIFLVILCVCVYLCDSSSFDWTIGGKLFHGEVLEPPAWHHLPGLVSCWFQSVGTCWVMVRWISGPQRTHKSSLPWEDKQACWKSNKVPHVLLVWLCLCEEDKATRRCCQWQQHWVPGSSLTKLILCSKVF